MQDIGKSVPLRKKCPPWEKVSPSGKIVPLRKNCPHQEKVSPSGKGVPFKKYMEISVSLWSYMVISVPSPHSLWYVGISTPLP